ncbi:hypothetical protein GOODEAATRI_022741 [Goodea atripinnis]|uniref:Calponin-homology (CH) domain-containing protein n=1 Tax=Goodea atripinnis TaxID=208336 RepID=A0ABV0PQW1_9TELE
MARMAFKTHFKTASEAGKALGWKNNVPSAAAVIANWKPTGEAKDTLLSEGIKDLIKNQKWRLLVHEIEGKGWGVLTTRRFLKGEVVCDYYGKDNLRRQIMKSAEQTVTWLITLGVLESPKKSVSDPEAFLQASLQDGVVLCRLLDRVRPGTVDKVSGVGTNWQSNGKPRGRLIFTNQKAV